MADILKPLTALGHDTPYSVTIGTVTIDERFDIALASVALRRGRDKDLAKLAKSADLPLPGPARAETGDPYSTFWITPDMWIVTAPFVSHEDIADRLKSALGDAVSVTEQTDAWVIFDLSGPDLTPLLERLTNLDLVPQPVGFAARTVIDHLGLYLIKQTETEVRLYGPRASAQSLLHALEVAATSLL